MLPCRTLRNHLLLLGPSPHRKLWDQMLPFSENFQRQRREAGSFLAGEVHPGVAEDQFIRLKVMEQAATDTWHFVHHRHRSMGHIAWSLVAAHIHALVLFERLAR